MKFEFLIFRLSERAAELNAQEMSCKKSREGLSEDEEIELPGAKCASSASATDSPGAIGGVSALARDARRLKTATLERMGKMLKLNSKSGVDKVRFNFRHPLLATILSKIRCLKQLFLTV